jgi:hypothetical protein
MRDPNKHYVIVARSQVEDYLQRGYARSKESILDYLPVALPDGLDLELLDQVLMETARAAYEAANAPPVRYVVDLVHESHICRGAVSKVEVLQEEGRTTYVGKGDGATRVWTTALFENPRDAVADVATEIRAAIDAHREAADNLEAYLKSYDL